MPLWSVFRRSSVSSAPHPCAAVTLDKRIEGGRVVDDPDARPTIKRAARLDSAKIAGAVECRELSWPGRRRVVRDGLRRMLRGARV